MLVTSSGQGKGTVAINLTITIVQSGKKVLLLDCDFRKPSIHKKLALPNREGLTNILIKDKNIEDCILSISTSNLFVLTNGAIPPNSYELLGTKKMKNIIINLKELFLYNYNRFPTSYSSDRCANTNIKEAFEIIKSRNLDLYKWILNNEEKVLDGKR
nr:CpsD/CapB family tyrosine-protein kinase [Clostridium algidicarnis]